jgi:hypothetical protein
VQEKPGEEQHHQKYEPGQYKGFGEIISKRLNPYITKKKTGATQ